MSSQGPQPNAGKLLSEFSKVGFEEWRALVQSELKDAPFDKKMFTTTPEGIKLQPIYRPESVAALAHVNSYPGFAPFVRGAHSSGYVQQSWSISQEIAYS